MSTLHLSVLRPEARSLFDQLRDSPELEGLTLVGGTALALQINHRISLDFDFAAFSATLPCGAIEAWASRLKSEDRDIRLITDPALISQFKINRGEDLLQYARDYVVDGIKVTFFILGKNTAQRRFYQQSKQLREGSGSFGILGLDGLKVAKTLVLADRVRARDLFDLGVLMRDNGYGIEEAIDRITSLGHIDDPEHYKAVMSGRIPLDRDDEGLEAVNLDITMDEIYAFFDKAIAEYEIGVAARFFSRK